MSQQPQTPEGDKVEGKGFREKSLWVKSKLSDDELAVTVFNAISQADPDANIGMSALASGEEKRFTLAEALEIWEAGKSYGGDGFNHPGTMPPLNKKQYFKKFGIDI